jgi:DNA-binding MarR family transcriptional regulator
MSMKKLKTQLVGPKLDEQVCYNLYATSNVITQAYKSLLGELALTYPQFVVMMALWQQDNIPVSALAETIGLSKATMTPLLRRLEKFGYIVRQQADDDERKKLVALTEKGRQAVTVGNDVASQALCETGLTLDEAKQLIQLCQKIRLTLNES